MEGLSADSLDFRERSSRSITDVHETGLRPADFAVPGGRREECALPRCAGCADCTRTIRRARGQVTMEVDPAPGQDFYGRTVWRSARRSFIGLTG